MDEHYEARTQLWRWSVRGAGLGAGLLLMLVVALTVQAAASVVVMVIAALLLASALRPLMHAVRVRTPMSRVPIVLTIYVLVVAAVVTLVALLVPAAIDQGSDLAARLPVFAEDVRTWAAEMEPAFVGTTLGQIIDTVDQALSRTGVTRPDPDAVVEAGLTASDLVLAVLSTFTMAFFWLISRETIQRFLLAMLPLSARRETRLGWNEIENRMGYWVRGQLTLMLVVGTASAVAYLVIGLPNALLLGVFAGLVEIVPIIGPVIGVIPALVIALATGGVELFLLVVAIYVVVQVVEGQILVPIVMKEAVGLPPFVVMVSLLVGGAVAGLIGALLAVPVATAISAIMENTQARHRVVAMNTPDFDASEEPPWEEDEPVAISDSSDGPSEEHVPGRARP
ncbi:MAG: AI-2E family transporter [Candidatus Limnocylindrales bacterium]